MFILQYWANLRARFSASATARQRRSAIKREAFTIAKDATEYVLRQKGVDLADVDTDEIEHLAVQIIAKRPDITKEAERRVDRRSKMLASDLLSAGNGESS